MVAIARPLAVRPNLPTGLGYKTGFWYGPASVNGSYGTSVVTANITHFAPFLCRKTTTFDRIAIYNTAVSSVNMRLGIFADDNGNPGTRVIDAGQVTAGGAAGDNAATISQSLTGGSLYWLAVNSDNNITTQFITASTAAISFDMIADFGLPAASTFAAGMNTRSATETYGAYAATAATIDGVLLGCPLIRLRAA